MKRNFTIQNHQGIHRTNALGVLVAGLPGLPVSMRILNWEMQHSRSGT